MLLPSDALRHDELVAPRTSENRKYRRALFISPTVLSSEISLIFRQEKIANRVSKVSVITAWSEEAERGGIFTGFNSIGLFSEVSPVQQECS
jgi:hypothetical protein